MSQFSLRELEELLSLGSDEALQASERLTTAEQLSAAFGEELPPELERILQGKGPEFEELALPTGTKAFEEGVPLSPQQKKLIQEARKEIGGSKVPFRAFPRTQQEKSATGTIRDQFDISGDEDLVGGKVDVRGKDLTSPPQKVKAPSQALRSKTANRLAVALGSFEEVGFEGSANREAARNILDEMTNIARGLGNAPRGFDDPSVSQRVMQALEAKFGEGALRHKNFRRSSLATSLMGQFLSRADNLDLNQEKTIPQLMPEMFERWRGAMLGPRGRITLNLRSENKMVRQASARALQAISAGNYRAAQDFIDAAGIVRSGGHVPTAMERFNRGQTLEATGRRQKGLRGKVRLTDEQRLGTKKLSPHQIRSVERSATVSPSGISGSFEEFIGGAKEFSSAPRGEIPQTTDRVGFGRPDIQASGLREARISAAGRPPERLASRVALAQALEEGINAVQPGMPTQAISPAAASAIEKVMQTPKGPGFMEAIVRSPPSAGKRVPADLIKLISRLL